MDKIASRYQEVMVILSMKRPTKKSYPERVEKAKKIFRDRGGVLRTGEALGAGIHPRALYEMPRSGTYLEALA